MGTIREWLIDTFGNEVKPSQEWSAQMKELLCEARELVINNYAQSIVAELYGALLSQCDFITYINGEVVEKDVWYRLNVEPNPNQSSSEFMRQLARQLIFKGEALIIKTDNGSLYVASDFMKGNYQLAETHFKNVWVDVYGSDSEVPAYQLTGEWYGDKAIYIRYQNPNVLGYIKEMGNLYKNLIDNVKRAGSSAIKYSLSVDATAQNGVDFDLDKELARILNEDFEALVNEKHALIPLMNGFKLETLNPANNNAQNSAVASNNINNMFEDVLANVGRIYNVPKSFMLGTYEQNDMDEFLTFGLDPLCSLIGECVNRKYYGKRQILQRTYCRLDTKKVKHFDILTISDSINKLISSGVYSINELRKLLEEPLIDKEIGDKHWITRNYAVVGDYINEMTNYTANDPKTQVGNEDTEDDNE